MAANMTIGQELEFIRKKAGLSIVDICNIMDVSETDYEKICSGSVVPTRVKFCVKKSRHLPAFLIFFQEFFQPFIIKV